MSRAVQNAARATSCARRREGTSAIDRCVVASVIVSASATNAMIVS